MERERGEGENYCGELRGASPLVLEVETTKV